MTFFDEADSFRPFVKMGIYGKAGSGKTFTATQIAIEIAKRCDNKPIAFFDTESGTNFVTQYVKDAGIKPVVKRSRSFVDMVDAIKVAEKECSVLVIDSVSHVWDNLWKSYLKDKTQTLEIHQWAPIKSQWQDLFVMNFLNSKLHIIICGRCANDIDYDWNEDTNKREVIPMGERMKAEKEFSHEPDFVIMMKGLTDAQLKLAEARGLATKAERKKAKAQIKNISKSKLNHWTFCEKDRTNNYTGHEFMNPTFNDFAKYFDSIDWGKEHKQIDSGRNTKNLFPEDQSGAYHNEKRQQRIHSEKIMGYLSDLFPGRADKDKNAKRRVSEMITGSNSWEEIENMPSETLRKHSSAISNLKDAVTSEIPNTDDYYDMAKVSDIWKRLKAINDAVQEDIDI
jgi:hypothetical protein